MRPTASTIFGRLILAGRVDFAGRRVRCRERCACRTEVEMQTGVEGGFSTRGFPSCACAHANVHSSSVAVPFVWANAVVVDPLQRTNCASHVAHRESRSTGSTVALSPQCNCPSASSVSSDQSQRLACDSLDGLVLGRVGGDCFDNSGCVCGASCRSCQAQSKQIPAGGTPRRSISSWTVVFCALASASLVIRAGLSKEGNRSVKRLRYLPFVLRHCYLCNPVT